MAQQGYDSVQILRHYYGDNIELVTNAPMQDIQYSYPGAPLRLGDISPEVQVAQIMIDRRCRGRQHNQAEREHHDYHAAEHQQEHYPGWKWLYSDLYGNRIRHSTEYK